MFGECLVLLSGKTQTLFNYVAKKSILLLENRVTYKIETNL